MTNDGGVMGDPAIELRTAQRAGGGDFSDFFGRWHRPLTRYVTSRFGAADAEEIVQETLSRAWAKFPTLQARRDPWPWLATVTRNVGCDMLRHRRRCPPVPADTLSRLPDADATPEQVTLDHERRAAVAAAWAGLTDGERQLLALRADGVSVAELARLEQASEGAVRVRIFRARQHLGQACRGALGPLAAAPLPLLTGFLRRLRRLLTPSAGVGSVAVAAMVAVATLAVPGSGPELAVGHAVGPAPARQQAERPVADTSAVTARPVRTAGTVLVRIGGSPAPAPVFRSAPKQPAPGWSPSPPRVAVSVSPHRPGTAGPTDEESVELSTPVGTLVVHSNGWNTGGKSLACTLTGVDCG